MRPKSNEVLQGGVAGVADIFAGFREGHAQPGERSWRPLCPTSVRIADHPPGANCKLRRSPYLGNATARMYGISKNCSFPNV
jgi:hypothetical protein